MSNLLSLLATFFCLALIAGMTLFSIAWVSVERLASTTFIATQTAVLSCRAGQGQAWADKVCGPIPSPADFQNYALPLFSEEAE